MSPTLWGERMAFPCRQCHRWIAFDRESAAQKSLFPCLHCGTWQIAPAAPRHVSADRVLIKKLATGQQITPEAIVVVEHPTFGLTIKRVSRLMGDQYYVLGDSPENSIDSRNPRFGLVRRAQIRGIVVKILPAIPLAGAKAK